MTGGCLGQLRLILPFFGCFSTTFDARLFRLIAAAKLIRLSLVISQVRCSAVTLSRATLMRRLSRMDAKCHRVPDECSPTADLKAKAAESRTDTCVLTIRATRSQQ